MRSFFDTKVLVYMFDGGAPGKQSRAIELFEQALVQGRALLSTQVLQEFSVDATRKLSPPMPHELAERVIRAFAELPVVRVDPGHYHQRNRYYAPLWFSFLGWPDN